MTNPSARQDTPPHRTPALEDQGRLRVSIFAELPSLLREMGQDPDRLLAEAGVDPLLLADPDNLMPFQIAGNLLRHCVIRTHCAHFGLLLGQRGSTATLGKVGLLARSSPDVRSALRSLIKHMHHHDEGAVPTLKIEGDTALLGYAIYAKAVPGSDQIYAGALAIALRIMRELVGADFWPSKVWLPFRKPRDPVPFSRFFGARLLFDATHGALVFPATLLDRPLRRADPEEKQRVEALLEAGETSKLSIRARRALRAMLADENISEAQLAAHFCMSRRTLIRQLMQEGTSFDVLVRDVRFQVAMVMLKETDNAIAEIAASVGYGSASAFTRAFRSWTGHSPTDWRKRNPPAPTGP